VVNFNPCLEQPTLTQSAENFAYDLKYIKVYILSSELVEGRVDSSDGTRRSTDAS